MLIASPHEASLHASGDGLPQLGNSRIPLLRVDCRGTYLLINRLELSEEPKLMMRMQDDTEEVMYSVAMKKVVIKKSRCKKQLQRTLEEKSGWACTQRTCRQLPAGANS